MSLIKKIGYDQISEQIKKDGFLGVKYQRLFYGEQELIEKLFGKLFGS